MKLLILLKRLVLYQRLSVLFWVSLLPYLGLNCEAKCIWSTQYFAQTLNKNWQIALLQYDCFVENHINHKGLQVVLAFILAIFHLCKVIVLLLRDRLLYTHGSLLIIYLWPCNFNSTLTMLLELVRIRFFNCRRLRLNRAHKSHLYIWFSSSSRSYIWKRILMRSIQQNATCCVHLFNLSLARVTLSSNSR